MDAIAAESLRKLRDLAILRRDMAVTEIASLDHLLLLVESDLAELAPVTEVMRRLGVGKSTVYDLIANGRLPARRIGRSVRVPLDAVEAFQRQGDAAVPLTRHGQPLRIRPTPARQRHGP
jgi:excisionase family DNA binding protein